MAKAEWEPEPEPRTLWVTCPSQPVGYGEPVDTFAVYEAFGADPGAYGQPGTDGDGNTSVELDIEPSLCP